MELREFSHLIRMAINGKHAALGRLGKTRFKDKYVEQGKWAIDCLEKAFLDSDQNVRKWLSGEKCIYRNPKTNAPIEVEIGYDIDAIYQFLCYCLMRKLNQEVSEDFFDNLVLTITRSNCKYWEEC